MMLKLKLQYFGHLMRRTNSFDKTLMLGKIEGRRGRGRQRIRWLDGITDSMDRVSVNFSSWQWRTGKPGALQSMRSQRVGHDLVTEQQQYSIYMLSQPRKVSPSDHVSDFSLVNIFYLWLFESEK